MKIYFAIQCHNFELRNCWQISSIIQQRKFRGKIMIDCAILDGDDNPLRFPENFRKVGLRSRRVALQYHETEYDTFARRGLVRNEQVRRARKAEADYVFFADADHVYPPDFFFVLERRVRSDPTFRGALTAARKLHTKPECTQRPVEAAIRGGGKYVRNAYARAWEIGFRLKKDRLVAGGAMQVVPLHRLLTESDGLYCDPEDSWDRHMFEKYQFARSDLQFRRRIGGSYVVDLPLQIHLDHRRDKECGKHHLYDQR